MNFFNTNPISENQMIDEFGKGIKLYLKREDLLETGISGNKFRKLKYNIATAEEKGHRTLLTYGGAFSNHIAATARAGKLTGLQTVGIIRGEELGVDLNKTLQQNATLRQAHQDGMNLQFISRSAYREKGTDAFRACLPNGMESVLKQFQDFYEIPEGGTNALAIKGCMEILTSADANFDYICCPAGTGGTAAGIIEAAKNHQKTLVFSALKGNFLKAEIQKYSTKKNWELFTGYHFGGYASVNTHLIRFINDFKAKYKVQLDPIYTGKMLYGIYDLIRNGYFSKNTRILAVHTGGLQGIAGINTRLKKQGSPLIDYNG